MSFVVALFACSDPSTPAHEVEARPDQGHVPEPGPGTVNSPGPDGVAPAPTPPTPMPADGTAVGTDGKACNIDGNWTGTLPAGDQPWNGKPMTAAFKSDGIFDATGPLGTRSASWKWDNGVLTVDKSTATGQGACKADQVGHYKGTFGPDCKTITFEKVDDQCPGRENGLVGYTLTRAP